MPACVRLQAADQQESRLAAGRFYGPVGAFGRMLILGINLWGKAKGAKNIDAGLIEAVYTCTCQ